MRVDQLARRMAELRGSSSPQPAEDLFRFRVAAFQLTGQQAADRYGLFIHYTPHTSLAAILSSGEVGRGGSGVWLTPTDYASCICPSNLGLSTPVDTALILDVAGVPALWGPGTAVPSSVFAATWTGGGVEFYSPTPLAIGAALVDAISIDGCGGGHP